jgi:hypothetical protein
MLNCGYQCVHLDNVSEAEKYGRTVTSDTMEEVILLFGTKYILIQLKEGAIF